MQTTSSLKWTRERNKPTFNSIDENIVDLKNKLDSEDSFLFAAYK